MSPPLEPQSGPVSGFRGLTGFSLKQLVAWGDHLHVDQPQLDAQHQGICDIALEVVDIWHKRGDLDQLKEVAAKLGRVLESHFRYEEKQLADIGYTKLDAHRAEHRVMLDELRLIRDRLDGMQSGRIDSEPGFLVLSYVLGVTIGHISHSDMDYRQFAREATSNERTGWPAA